MDDSELLLTLLQGAFFACLAGGVIGLERERRQKSAGIKTNVLICLGAMIFTRIGALTDAPDRIIAQVVSGIGFLGAGAIIHPSANRVSGLTTASMAWAVAGLGILVGLGHGLIAVALSLLIVGLTTLISWIGRRFFPRPR